MTDTEPIEILIADDNEDDLLLINEALSESKFLNLMQVVRDGEEALAYLRRQGCYDGAKRPGLVLLDINMPKMNGLEVLGEIKSDKLLSCLPVVIMTVSDREKDLIDSYAKGACSYIRKPVNFAKLCDVVSTFELYWTLVARIPPTN